MVVRTLPNDATKLVPDEIKSIAVGCSIKLNQAKLPSGFGAHPGTDSSSS